MNRRKIYIMVTALFMAVILSGCGENFTVIEEDKMKEFPEVHNYIELLQKEKPDYRGYKVFTNEDGAKIVVISAGSGSKSLKLSRVHQSGKDTAIEFEERNIESEDVNPYLIVELDDIVGAFYVYEVQKEEIRGTGYYDE